MNLKIYQLLVYLKNKIGLMPKNTSILLGDYFDNFISHQVESGRFSSASEVVRAALRLFEQEEKHKSELIKELKFKTRKIEPELIKKDRIIEKKTSIFVKIKSQE